MSAKNMTAKKKRPAAKPVGMPGKKPEHASSNKGASVKKKNRPAAKGKAAGQAGKSAKKTKKKKKSESLTAEAVRIVEQAATILEEEISAGIVAAKKVEERYVNVDTLRSGESEQVMQRFRKDAHEVLDIILDLINLSINAVSGLSERAVNIRSTAVFKDKGKAESEDSLAELVVPEVLKPGESGKVGMLVENENEHATGPFEFSTSGLLNTTGDRLDAQYISFDPASMEIGANDLEKVTVTVSVPEGTPAGNYSGLVQAASIQMRAMLTVQVAA